MSPGAANLFPFFSEENNPLYLDPAERAANEACRTVALTLTLSLTLTLALTLILTLTLTPTP